jgi:hypothetical protein
MYLTYKAANLIDSQHRGYLGQSAFGNGAKWAFHMIDTDNTNSVDETELYSGFLFISNWVPTLDPGV